MNQKYEINFDEATIETSVFSLPTSENTTIEFVEIFSPAKIPCSCWEGTREIIAKENGLIIKGNIFYKRFDSIENLMNGVTSAIRAVKRLELSKKVEDKRRANQEYVEDFSS